MKTGYTRKVFHFLVFATVAVILFLFFWGLFLWPLMVTIGPGVRPLPVAIADFQTLPPLKWGDIMAFGVMMTPALVIDAGNAHDNTVTVHHLAHFAWQQEEIFASIVRDQESETIRVTSDTPSHQVQLVHRGKPTTCIYELPIPLHGPQPAS